MTNKYGEVTQLIRKASKAVSASVIVMSDGDDIEILHQLADIATRLQSCTHRLTERQAEQIKGQRD